jgi:hypothetical protein
VKRRFSSESLPVSSFPSTLLKEFDWRVSPQLLEEALKSGSSREFFFKLVASLTGGRVGRKELKRLPHGPFVERIVEANELSPYFFPSRSVYTALRNAFLRRERERVELEWELTLKNWREELESFVRERVERYRSAVKELDLLFKLYEKEWLVPVWTVNLYAPFKGVPFEEWLREFLTADRVEREVRRWLSLPAYRRREKVLQGVLHCYRLGHLEMAIYALFPLSEGAVWDSLVKDNPFEADLEALIRKRNRKFVSIQYAVKVVLELLFGSQEIPSFIDWHPFVDYREGFLNRHAVEHGVAVNFGTFENFAKVLLFNGFLCDLFSPELQTQL